MDSRAFLLLSLALLLAAAAVGLWMYASQRQKTRKMAQHLAHKTVLSALAWLIFGVLLFGRLRFGWRGRRAVRLVLSGIVLLVLAYFGSKFVLELVLSRQA